MQRENAQPSEVLYIGDSDYDRQCAANAGVDFIRALWGKISSDAGKTEKTVLTPADIIKLIEC